MVDRTLENDVEESRRRLEELESEHESNEFNEELAKCYLQLGLKYYEGGAYEMAACYFSKLLDLKMKSYLNDEAARRDVSLGELHNHIGLVQLKRQHYKLSHFHYLRALEIFEACYGQDAYSENIARTYNHMAELKREMCEYEEANQWHMKGHTLLECLGKWSSIITVKEEMARNYRLKGDILVDQAKFKLAAEQYKKAYDVYDEMSYSPDTPARATQEWAGVCCQQGLMLAKGAKYEEANKKCSSALDMLMQVDEADDDISYAVIYDATGDVFMRGSDYDEALFCYQTALDIRLKYFKNSNSDDEDSNVCYNYPSVANNYHRLGYFYAEKCKNAEALENYEEAVAIYTSIYGQSHHVETGVIYNSLGNYYYNLCQLEKSISYFSKALKIYETTFGENISHVNIALTNYYTGHVYSELGDHAKALEYQRKSWCMNMTLYQGDKHPSIYHNYLDMSEAYSHLGDPTNGAKYIDKAFDVLKTVFEDNAIHPDAINLFIIDKKVDGAIDIAGELYGPISHLAQGELYMLLGDQFCEKDEYRKAMEAYEMSSSIYSKLDGETKFESYATIKLHTTLGRMHFDKSKISRAKEELELAADQAKRIFGEEQYHPLIANLDTCKGDVQDYVGDSEGALKLYLKALKARQHIYSNHKKNTKIVSSLFDTAILYLKLGLYFKAYMSYTDCVELMKKFCEGQTPVIELAHCYTGMGNTCEKLCQFTDAEHYYTESLRLATRLYGEDTKHEEVANIHTMLGHLYASQGDYDKAFDSHSKARELNDIISLNASLKVAKCNDDIGQIRTFQGQWQHAINALGDSLSLKSPLFERHKKQNLHSADVSEDSPEGKRIIAEAATIYLPQIAITHCYIGNVHYMEASSSRGQENTTEIRFSKYQRALASYKTALEMLLEAFGEDGTHADIAKVLNNIGLVLQHELVESMSPNNYEEALEYHRKSLAMRQKLYQLNKDHPDIATSYKNVGHIHTLRGEFDEALENHSKALEILDSVSGEDTNKPALATIYENIGTTYYQSTDYTHALENYLKSYKIQSAIHGGSAKCNVELASICTNMSNVYDKLGQQEESEKFREMADKYTKKL